MITLHEGLNPLDVSLTPLPVEEYPFTYEDLEISAPVIVGYPVTISCRVMLCNAPIGVSITHPVTFYINNTPMSSQDVTLVCEFLCAQTRVEFQFTPGSTRTYQVEIDGLIGSFEAVLPIFVNTPLELVKDAVNEFADVLAGHDLSGGGSLKDAYFTFDPTVVQPDPYEAPLWERCKDGYYRDIDNLAVCTPYRIPDTSLNCTIRLSISTGWTLGARLIAVKASEYESWLSGIGFMKWGMPGRLGQGIYGLGFPKIIELPTPAGGRTIGSTCGDYDCHSISSSESYGGWQGCRLRSGDHEFNVNGLLNLEPGSWVVLASFVLSICDAFMTGVAAPPPPDDRGPGPHMTYLPLNCNNYKIYQIGTIDF